MKYLKKERTLYLCGHTPFDYVYAPTDANNEHVAVTQQISEWFESEVRCNRTDLPVLFTPDIVGSSVLCATQDYSLLFCQPGNHTITWVSSNPGLASVSGSGDQISLTPHAQGNVTLTATITYPGIYSKPVIITKSNIAVGKPFVSGTYSYNAQSHPMQYYSGTSTYNPVCNSITANTNMEIINANTVNWQRIAASISSLTWNQNLNDINFYFWSVGQTEVFRINASNTCGTTTYDFGFKSIDCSGGGGGCLIYQLSPNPATSTVQVTVVPNIPAPCNPAPVEMAASQESTSGISTMSGTQKRYIQNVSIYDSKGNFKQQQNYGMGNKQATLNVSNLPTGVYVVQITDGTYTETQRMIIGK